MGIVKMVPVAAAALLLAGCVSYPAGGGHYGGYGGHGGPAQRPGGYGSQGYGQSSLVRCESDDNRSRRCSADTRGGVVLSRQLSRTRCEQGRNWGWDNAGIWVSQGCRAEFMTGRGGYGSGNRPVGSRPGVDGNRPRTVRCESQKDRYQRCAAPGARQVQLSRQLSKTRCVRGQNWNWDRSGIWVDKGCRAEFTVR